MKMPFSNCQGCKRRRERLVRWCEATKKALGGSVQEPEKSTADFSGVSSQKGSGHVKK